MEITKVNKDEIISVGREALGKIKNNELAVLDNITITLALIIGAGLDKGYKIRIPFYEFSDFSGLITKVAKVESCIAVISIPRNPPLNVLNGIRKAGIRNGDGLSRSYGQAPGGSSTATAAGDTKVRRCRKPP